ncbi:MBL fold metallo-hydrolase [Bradyrhizobium sp. CB82]|uniref:MBL fold metallo-hydrolase n=1 Tax=Bradyrhizobium sp. CB82 TaxID=3039159 RepID=UPI0024B16070|nr:MBL fold metallo-hydrolase [Bradyrhizobium sp. CB82]WFU44021.1 MBL fold metallo-hydrolase [Bradyrhizobium sp. CB82]
MLSHFPLGTVADRNCSCWLGAEPAYSNDRSQGDFHRTSNLPPRPRSQDFGGLSAGGSREALPLLRVARIIASGHRDAARSVTICEEERMPPFQRATPTSFRAEEVSSSPLTGRRELLRIGCACCLALVAPRALADAMTPEVERHLAAAEQAAGTDLKALLVLGKAADPNFQAPPQDVEKLIALPAPPPGKAFDNLYFVGGKWVSSWALTTSDGIILFDAMNNDNDAEQTIERGLRTIGLDPSKVKTIIVTHGHGDHYGGANYFARKYGSRIVLSEADWTMMETKPEFDRPVYGRPPKRDVAVADGDKITLGDAAVDILITPGHTMGTISPIFDVRSGSQSHRVLLWGGTAFNFGRQPERLQAYVDATARAREVAKQRGVDVFISNHSFYDGSIEKLATAASGGSNPFVQGAPTVERALTVMNECAQAVLTSWKA